MKLYKVTIERDMMVVAEDEDAAQEVAIRYEYDNLEPYPDFIHAREVTEPKDIATGWDESACCPFGYNPTYLNCRQVLEGNKT